MKKIVKNKSLPVIKKKPKKIKKKVTVSAIIPDTPISKTEATPKIRPEITTFYGHPIRHTFMNNQWYFSLEDILKVAKVIDPTKMLIELKNLDSIKDKYYQLTETFSYYEGDNPIIIPVINFQSFLEILPSIRALNYFLPGPFPEWLKNAANRKF